MQYIYLDSLTHIKLFKLKIFSRMKSLIVQLCGKFAHQVGYSFPPTSREATMLQGETSNNRFCFGAKMHPLGENSVKFCLLYSRISKPSHFDVKTLRFLVSRAESVFKTHKKHFRYFNQQSPFFTKSLKKRSLLHWDWLRTLELPVIITSTFCLSVHLFLVLKGTLTQTLVWHGVTGAPF